MNNLLSNVFFESETISVFKIEKTKDFNIMNNYYLRDKNLRYKATGLLSFMLSLPDDWVRLTPMGKEIRDSIRTILKELQKKLFRNRESNR